MKNNRKILSHFPTDWDHALRITGACQSGDNSIKNSVS